MNKRYAQECFPILRDFLGYLETVKGHSSKTIDGYFIDLRTFFRFMKRFRGLVPPEIPDLEIGITEIDLNFIRSITLTDVYEFLNDAKNERDNNNKTLARKCVSLRMFFKHLTNYTHQLEQNPIQNLETPKSKKTLPKYLTLEQSNALLQSVDGEYPERDYCLLTLLLNCGLRRAEVAGLNLSDIRSDHTMRVLGKGNKERIVYLNQACQDALKSYLAVRPRDGVKDKDALFLSRLKQRISLQGVHYVVKGYLRKLDGLQGYSTHKLRHTAATLMYQYGGVDIRVLKEILGHENLGTTEIYTHLSDEQIRKAADQNPLSGVKPPSMKKKSRPSDGDNQDEDS
ncbi:MAG: tyrosine-type recombinase/integrase [Clostridiales bacterium]|jgi:site-specific recombinase XerD|nr:tyrosine-type recombinase/integrase [Clostridiales bacterium]